MNQTNIIKKTIAQIEATKRQDTNHLFAEASKLFNETIFTLTEQVFNNKIPEHQYIKVDTIEINLGVHSFPFDEQNIAIKYRDLLEEAITNILLQKQDESHNPQLYTYEEGKQANYSILLEQYLAKGIMPWWATGKEMTEPQKVFDYLYKTNKEQLKYRLSRVLNNANTIKRFVYHFNEASIVATIYLYEPQQAKFIVDYHTQISNSQKEKNEIKASSSDFKKSVWLFILNFLLIEHSSVFNKKMFVKSTLQAIAMYYNISFEDLIAIISASIIPNNALLQVSSSLPNIINELKNETALSLNDDKGLNTVNLNQYDVDTSENVAYNLYIIEFYLLHHSLAFKAINASKNDLIIIFNKLIKKYPHQVKAMIEKFDDKEYMAKSIIDDFGIDITQALMKIIQPTYFLLITNLYRLLQEFESITHTLNTNTATLTHTFWQTAFNLLFNSYAISSSNTFIQTNIQELCIAVNKAYPATLFALNQYIQNSNLAFATKPKQDVLISQLIKEIVAANNVDTTENKLQIVALYLQNGNTILAAKSMSIQDVKLFLIELLSHQPNSIKDLIENNPNKTALIKNIVKAFNLPIFKPLLELYAAADTQFIINFHNCLSQFQSSTNKFNTTITTFNKSFWQIVFQYLFTQNIAPAFNGKKFVESVLQSVGELFNKEASDIVISFNKYLANITTANTENEVISILNSIVASTNNKQPSIDFKEKNHNINLQESTLLFYVQNGSLPWWASNMSEENLATQLNDFFEQHPQQALKMLQLIMLTANLFDGFYTKHHQQILKLLQHLAAAKQAIAIADTLLAENVLLHHQSISNKQHSIIIVFSILQNLKENDFNAFDTTKFIANYIVQVSIRTGNTVAQTSKQLSSELINITPSAATKNILQSIENIKSNNNGYHLQYETADCFTEEDIDTIILKNTQQQTDENNSLFVVEFFLQHHQLPPNLSSFAGTRLQYFLYKLLIYHFKTNTNNFKSLLGKKTHLPKARMFLYDIVFERKTTQTIELENFLASFLIEDVLNILPNENNLSNTNSLHINEVLKSILLLKFRISNVQQIRFVFSSPVMCYYAAQYYNTSDVISLLSNYGFDAAIPQLKQLFYVINLAATDSFERNTLHIYFNEFCLLWFFNTTNNHLSQDELMAQFLKFLAHKKSYSITQLSKQINKATLQSPHLTSNKLIAKLQTMASNYINDESYLKLLVKQFEPSLNTLQPAKAIAINTHNNETQTIKKTNVGKEPFIEQNESIDIQNAGLILLHPFFPTYFTKTALLHHNKFIDDHKKYHAAYLLQYTAFACIEAFEHQLVLNKILCGINIEEALPNATALSAEEIEISTQIIQGAMANWDKMKNTSVDGFRTSFLQRDGTLKLTEDGWQLKVEQRAYDIILQTIPWNTSVIKTSWMDKPLFIEWI